MSSIFNVNPDPDYPVLSGPGFVQHTCQPYNVQQQQQFYYNGQSVMPTFQQPNMMDSRRYDMPQQQPVMPVQQSAPTYGFNQLVENTRRNDAPAMTQNPWAVQPIAQPQQQPMMMPQPEPYIQPYDPRYSAIYQCHPSFDKKQGVWGTQEVYNPIMPPTVNWGAAPAAVPSQVPQYGYMTSQAMPTMQYPQVQQPIQQNWAEIAMQNWKK